MTISMTDTAGASRTPHVSNLDTGQTVVRPLAAAQTVTRLVPLEAVFGRHDLVLTAAEDPSFSVHHAGHVENGADRNSDPAIGWSGRTFRASRQPERSWTGRARRFRIGR